MNRLISLIGMKSRLQLFAGEVVTNGNLSYEVSLFLSTIDPRDDGMRHYFFTLLTTLWKSYVQNNVVFHQPEFKAAFILL